jgi:hypothetical protein
MRTSDYHELRVLLEDIVQAWPDTKAHPALDAARAYLRTHCRECGTRLSVKQIEEGRELCPACFARLFW